MNRKHIAALVAAILGLSVVGSVIFVDAPIMHDDVEPSSPDTEVTVDSGSSGGVTAEIGEAASSDETATKPDVAQPQVASAILPDTRRPAMTGPGVASMLAESQAERTPTPVRENFQRFIEQGRADYWADNAESLILDGINFSAFGSAYSDWAIECKTSMCLTVASIDRESYHSQQFLPLGGWMGMMQTIRQEIAPVLPFANDGVSITYRDLDTGQVWWLELWWLPEPEVER